MDSGNVPEVSGTGLRQYSGILSVVDVSGNNIATFTSNAIVLGNSTDVPLVEVIAPFVQLVDSTGPAIDLQNNSAPADQKNTLIRNTTTGAFAISSTADATPSTAAVNLISAQRNGVTWKSITFGSSQVLGGGVSAGSPIDMTPDAGAFTANYSGFAGTVTGAATWFRIGSIVILILRQAQGTSNANSFVLTNLPLPIQASTTQFMCVPSVSLLDNGTPLATSGLQASAITAGPVLQFVRNDTSIGWTAAGSKGISSTSPIVLVYALL